MKDVFCTHCGQKNAEGYRFCSGCGAPGSETADGNRPPVTGNPGPGGWNPYTPPPAKRPLYQILLLAGAGLLLAGALVFGAITLFAGGPSMDAISADFEDAAASPQTTQSTGASATVPAQTATPAPTMTPEVTATPLPTPVPTLTPAPTSVQIGYDAVILQYDVSGITEDEAYQMFGQPISRDLVEYPDGTDVFLTYDTFILKFYNEDATTTNCYEVQIISTPCPIDVFGLEIGMGTADVEAAMAGSPFELDYQEEDGSYWVYSNLMTGQNIFVDFIDGTVIDFSVFYSP